MRFLLLAVLLTACGSSTEPQLGENIEIRIGGVVQIPGDSQTLRFSDVTADSRCPTGVQCVWAGEATTVFNFGMDENVTLVLGADPAKARVISHGYQVTLVALKPYPSSTGPIFKPDYIATVQITTAKG